MKGLWAFLAAISAVCLPISSARSAAEDIAVEAFTLENGLTVLLRPSGKARQVALMTLYRMGGDHDPEERSGRAHLLEHLYVTAAAGTTPARTVAEFVRAYPDGWNAQTAFDATVFATVFKPDRLEAELADAAARMSQLKITEKDLEREIPRVLEELGNMYDRVPALAGLNHARKRLYPIAGDGQHGGNPEHVRKLTVQELTRAWENYYRPNNAILVLVGNFDAKEIRKRIEELFGPIPRGKEPPGKGARPERGADRVLRIKVQPPGGGAEGVVCLAYAAPQPGQKEYPAFLVVVARLWAKAGFKPGPVPPVHFQILDDPSTLALQAPLPKGKDDDEVIQEIEQRLVEALRPEVTPGDRMQAIQATAMMGTAGIPEALVENNPYGVALGLARCQQLGIVPKTLKSQIETVSQDDLKALAAGIFDPKRRVVVIVETQ